MAALLSLTVVTVSAVSAAAEVVIHSPEEVLRDHTVTVGDALMFLSPEGERWELVTDINDPLINNRGEGEFYPLDPEAVADAVEHVQFPLHNVPAEIFILPYPRRDILPSSAGHRTVYLTPGVAPLSRAQVHALVSHELGHVVHNRLLPDSDRQGWTRYRGIRGIEDETRFCATAVHRDRPHEIFAEDFRYLFGGDLANYSGSIENTALALPHTVDGLEPFMRELSDGGETKLVRRRARAFPNPTRAGVQLVLEAGAAGEETVVGDTVLRVYDVQGRRVFAARVPQGAPVAWSGAGADGKPAAPGFYFLHIDRGSSRWQGKVLVAR